MKGGTRGSGDSDDGWCENASRKRRKRMKGGGVGR